MDDLDSSQGHSYKKPTLMEGGSYIKEASEKKKCLTIFFSPKEHDEVGTLVRYLEPFKNHKVNLHHIESRSSARYDSRYEFKIECSSCDDASLNAAIVELKEKCEYFNIISRNHQANQETVPWFPRRIREIDQFVKQVLSYGAELDADHPGFTDPEYRARRKYFANLALDYKHGESIPRVDYTKSEIETWGKVFKQLVTLYPTHACKEHNHMFPLLIQNCGYGENQIPQLQDVSDFLRDCTGFTLRPVAGLLSSRDFLAGLAFRVFHSTQYVRHPSKPLYTPEPDVCHELLGHVPLFADPSFAQFSQEIGLASLGAPDEYIEKIATCYWFTAEFGICRQEGQLKAFGAGLLSSFGELEYCLSPSPVLKPFDPSVTALQKFPITEYQPIYFISESFDDAKDKMIKYSQTIPRNFGVRYNAYTQSVELLDSKTQVKELLQKTGQDLIFLTDVMSRIVV